MSHYVQVIGMGDRHQLHTLVARGKCGVVRIAYGDVADGLCERLGVGNDPE